VLAKKMSVKVWTFQNTAKRLTTFNFRRADSKLARFYL
jgi:hypothetical protein